MDGAAACVGLVVARVRVLRADADRRLEIDRRHAFCRSLFANMRCCLLGVTGSRRYSIQFIAATTRFHISKPSTSP